tara:strand:- start:275 stop:550 length:276 start_codon:yes stop_codon:yes gene_type:complete
MEILILILVVVGGWVLFKIVIPAMQMTREQMKDIGDAGKYVKSDHPIVRDSLAKNRFKFLVNKYMKKGYSRNEALDLAEQELANNPHYIDP